MQKYSICSVGLKISVQKLFPGVVEADKPREIIIVLRAVHDRGSIFSLLEAGLGKDDKVLSLLVIEIDFECVDDQCLNLIP